MWKRKRDTFSSYVANILYIAKEKLKDFKEIWLPFLHFEGGMDGIFFWGGGFGEDIIRYVLNLIRYISEKKVTTICAQTK